MLKKQLKMLFEHQMKTKLYTEQMQRLAIENSKKKYVD